jgi:pimeloyl-ACP methyl ester carboxylesterase
MNLQNMSNIVNTLSQYFEHFHEHTDSLRCDLPYGYSSLVGLVGVSLIAATGYRFGSRVLNKRKVSQISTNGFDECNFEDDSISSITNSSRSSYSDHSINSNSEQCEHHINKLENARIKDKRRRDSIVQKHGGLYLSIDGGYCYVQIRDPVDKEHDFKSDDELEYGYYPTTSTDQLIPFNYMDGAKIVVMIPGHHSLSVADSLSSIEMYDKLATHLNRKGIRVILFDFLGRGFSSHAPHISHSVDSYVSQMRQIIELMHLAERKISLLACSSSTKIALHYTHLFERCTEHDDAHIQKLVLISPIGFEFGRKMSLRRVSAALMRKSWFLSFIERFTDLEKMMKKRLTQGFSQRDHPSIKHITTCFTETKEQNPNWHNTAVRKLVEFGLSLSNEVDEDLIVLKNISNGGIYDDENGEEETRNFPMCEEPLPILLLWGKKDRVCMLSDLKPFAKYLPHAKVEIFDEAGHSLLFEEEKLVCESISHFLTE